MFVEAFNELQVPSHLLDRSITPLVSFSGEVVQPIGSIHLPISIGSAPQWRTITTPFLIIDCPTAYNVILGHPVMAQTKLLCFSSKVHQPPTSGRGPRSNPVSSLGSSWHRAPRRSQGGICHPIGRICGRP
ncbi:unnamed protein product [Prunus armeniaca]